MLSLYGCNNQKVDKMLLYKRFKYIEYAHPNCIEYTRNHFEKINDTIIIWDFFLDSTFIFGDTVFGVNDKMFIDSLNFRSILISKIYTPNIPLNNDSHSDWKAKINYFKKMNDEYSRYEYYYEVANKVYRIDEKSYSIIVYRYYFEGCDGEGLMYYCPDFGKIAGYSLSWDNLSINDSGNSNIKEMIEKLKMDTSFFPYPKELYKSGY